MSVENGWSRIEEEAQRELAARRRFQVRAYSESMPPPFVGIKPYEPRRSRAPATAAATGETTLDIGEYEQARELGPGLDRIAARVLGELRKLVRAEGHALSQALLHDNPAWPAELADAARRGALRDATLALALPLALSRTQDDKGNVPWTLFGTSHEGPATAFFRSFGRAGEDAATARVRLGRWVAWMVNRPELTLDRVGIVADPSDVPEVVRDRIVDGEVNPDEAIADGWTILTFRPFASLPASLRRAYVERRVAIVPAPASLVFFEHAGYRKLARELPRATQIALLQLFPRVQGGSAMRILQAGWIEEHDPAQHAHAHRIVSHVTRTHRWERVLRDEAVEAGDGELTDRVAVALFSTKPDDLGLYGKPMARNAQVWFETYELLLDGQTATPAEIARAAAILDAGGRFGYRFYYPPMRAGQRELTWHLPLVARLDAAGAVSCLADDPPLGHVTADLVGRQHEHPGRIELTPRLLARDGHRQAARLFDREIGHARSTTTNNARKLLEMRELLGRPLAPSFARRLLHVARTTTLDGWIDDLAARAADLAACAGLTAALREAIGREDDLGDALTLEATSTRAFEESVWRGIASLTEGAFRGQENADPVVVNEGRTGGAAAKAAAIEAVERRDLELLGDHLHARYRELVAKHGMVGRAACGDHVFRWETDFDFGWSVGWSKNQTGEAHERNVVLVIPGRNRAEAVIMGDHYDTAYMEDVYEPTRGGDRLRASASGADDNHSATTALLHAADALLPLARDGKLARDVWLVHLTGEEFPADCLGARALAEALLARRLVLTTEGQATIDLSAARVVGAFILDMIGHNADRDRDVFQIAAGEGAASARLALAAHVANERWNRSVAAWNQAEHRRGKGRAQRMPDGSAAPPPFAHLALAGEVRAEWEPRSALYNTDGQIFSDLGVPVVLFMENYDIRRSGYHDTHDTMKNIDLDYCAALTAIAIETVASVACADDV